MPDFDWHAERTDLDQIALLDAPAPAGADMDALQAYRLSRVRGQMAELGVAACILTDPVNIRYASGALIAPGPLARDVPARWVLVTAEDCILFDPDTPAGGRQALTDRRPVPSAGFGTGGQAMPARETVWATHAADALSELVGTEIPVAMERGTAGAVAALARHGFHMTDAQPVMERARAVKSADEMLCVNASLRSTERAVGAMRDAIRPGLTEARLWSVLRDAVLAQDAGHLETRLAPSGPRPVSGPDMRPLADNTLIALDTDVIGCEGYYCDFSRTFHAGPGTPTDAQKDLYKHAYDQVHHNVGILKPGLSFRDYAEQAWEIPERFFANRYYVSTHGVGMTGEYPYLYHKADFTSAGYDGELLPGMTLCVESYIGDEGGTEGVKLEQQVLITETGVDLLSRFPFEDDLLS